MKLVNFNYTHYLSNDISHEQTLDAVEQQVMNIDYIINKEPLCDPNYQITIDISIVEERI